MTRLARTLMFAFTTVVAALGMLIPAAPATASATGAPATGTAPDMVYDAATGQVVLFSGFEHPRSTWTWDGTDWTRLHPAHSPSARLGMNMVYDAARGSVVLFGGDDPNHSHLYNDTWTWDGTDWTKLHPAHAPGVRAFAGMAYDDTTAEAVLFGGSGGGGSLADTWSWDGSDWTRVHPAHSPPARTQMSMSYDAAEARVVLFSGAVTVGAGDDTWTWDGTDWTQQHPAHSPPARNESGTAYDAADGQVVLFGGLVHTTGVVTDDTWTWDGTDWTQQHPAHSPLARAVTAMTYDASTSTVVLFGGAASGERNTGDTWSWDGTDWTQQPAGAIELTPASGPAGASVHIEGWGFEAGEQVRITFVDSSQGGTFLVKARATQVGAFGRIVTIPAGATLGKQQVLARGTTSGVTAKARFTVT